MMTEPRSQRVKVLFICVHNSGRSQMAEAFLNALDGDRFVAESAGFQPTRIHPLVAEAMHEAGIDIAGKETKSVFRLYQEGRLFDFVITVCEESTENQCPTFPGVTRRLNWPFDNPETFEGTDEAKLGKVKRVRDEIREKIERWVREVDDLKDRVD